MKPLVFVLILSLLGNLAGLFIFYKFMKKNEYLADTRAQLDQKQKTIDAVNQLLPKRLVFLHHSVGRNWLSEGGLTDELVKVGISVQSATRGCEIGQETDIVHWAPKFKDQFEQIVHFDGASENRFNSTVTNNIIMFKSCYPNSDIVSDGAAVGNAFDSTKTIANYRATFDSLKNVFIHHPEQIFIYVTSPPLNRTKTNSENAKRARDFSNWIKDNFLREYQTTTGLSNLWVFDLFDILADKNNVLRKEFQRSETDSHPNKAGSRAATAAFMTFFQERLQKTPELAAKKS